ncbi:hypothetical protein MJI37_35875, partial [Salmonella enterica subsp. enterica serovar Cerro]|nr:hypothetical protein [Salmonella enterica subsp. enterica serovar Cerro]
MNELVSIAKNMVTSNSHLISLAHEAWYSETRLNSQHAVLDGTLDLSAGILHGTDSTSGNT